MGFDNSAMRYVRKISENPEMAHRKILARIKPGSTVLEFGPASGVMTRYLKEEKNCNVSIIEIDEDAFKIAMQFADHGICSDAQTFEWLEEFKGCKFDYILFIDILEHLTKAGEVLEKSSRLLKDDGSVLISIPNAAHNSVIIQMLHNQLLYQNTGILDYTHVHQYTFFELMRMCDESGYNPVYLDATYIAVGKNEFDVSYMDIDPKVAEYLRKRPLGEAYQFIAEIRKKSYLEQAEIKIEDALGFNTDDYNLDDDLLESLELIRTAQAERNIKALSDSPNKHLVFNNEIERLRLQINDMFEANKHLADSTKIVQSNYAYQEEVRAKNNHIKILQKNIEDLTNAKRKLDVELELSGQRIRTLQEEQVERDAHIRKLDSELETRGKRIQTLQEEQVERDAHIRELDSELETRGQRIQTLQEEQAERDTHIRELDIEMDKKGEMIRSYQEGEEKRNQHIRVLDKQIKELTGIIDSLNKEIEGKNQEVQDYREEILELDKNNKELQDLRFQAETERDQMEEQRNTLVRERDELKGYHQALTVEVASLQDKIKELQTDSKNKQGHIDLLLESDRELQRIHHSRSWKILSKWWRFRDYLVPPNSKRRLILKLFGKFIRHPIWCLQRVDRDHIQKFTDGVKNGSIISTSQRLDNYLGGRSENAEKPDQIPLAEYENIEDVPRLHIPTSNHPDVSIVIPVYNQFAYTYACLKSIAKNSGDIQYEVIIADDCSTDLTQHIKKAISGIRVIRTKENLRFLRNCNNAARQAKGKYILFLNNDTQVMDNWLQPLITLMESSDDIGMVGSKLIYPDGHLQEAGGIVWKDASAWNFGHLDDPTKPEYMYVREVDYVSGASIMIRSELWEKLKGFDERYAPAYYEDTDLAFMVRDKGFRVMYQPLSVVVHYEGVSNGTDTNEGLKSYQTKNREKFLEKWKNVLESEQDTNGQNVFKAKDRSQRRKHLLVVDHYVPHYDKDAGGRSTYMYLKLFLKMGFKVTFIGDNFFRHEPYTTELNQLGIEVLYGNYYFANWQSWLKENGKLFDYIYLQRPHIAIKYIDLVTRYSDAKVIYFAHDLHHVREKREYEITGNKELLESSEQWKEKEYKLFSMADVGHVVGSYEQEIMQKAFPNKPIRNIPLYLYESLPKNINKDFSHRNDLLYVGGFNHHPNVDAVLWFAREIYPAVLKKYPDMVWHILGGHLTKEIEELAGEHIRIHGFVSDEELEQFYRTCRIAVVPLRYGAGVKGKVIEANYYQIPLVTTPIGAEGISLEEESMVVVETAEDMISEICSLYSDQKRLRMLSDHGEKLIRNHYMLDEAERIIRLDFQP